MKNIFLIGLLVIGLQSCQKYLDRPPLDRITDKEMTFTASEMKLYSNQFYPDFPGWKPNEYTGGIFWGDNASDNMVQGVYNSNGQISGTITIPASSGDWDWGKIRAVNYFLFNYHVTEEQPAAVNSFIGEMYFWRAWYYYSMLKKYGDLPYFSRPLGTNDTVELKAPRLKRNIIADSILADLDLAIGLLGTPASVEPGRINKGVALTFKSRVALYEGSWEKYQAGSVFGVDGGDPDKYFQQAADAAEQVMLSGDYEITPPSIDPQWNYFHLFSKKDLTGNKEIILWKKFDKSLNLIHFGQNMLSYEGSNTGVSKQLVDAYLCTDGLPISISPLYEGDDSITAAVTNRDPRLRQTILVRGHPRQIVGGDTILKFSEPAINLPGGQRSTTGYMLFKGSEPDDAGTTGSTTASIIFRYAEVLLIYAEAKAELSEITQEDLDKSVNKLRDRVQMPHMSVAVGFTDPDWDFPELSPLLNEIRRERRAELGVEGYRFDDLMRWRAHRLIKQPLLGAKFSQFVGKEFNPPLIDISVNDQGYILPLKNSPAVNGWQFDENKNYLLPIPSNELVLNPNMSQNPGY